MTTQNTNSTDEIDKLTIQKMITDYHETGKGGHNNVVYLERQIQALLTEARIDELRPFTTNGADGRRYAIERTAQLEATTSLQPLNKEDI